MTAPIIPVYSGTVPQRTQAAAVFSTNADDWLAYQEPLAADYNALAVYLDALAVDVEADVVLSEAAVVAAEAAVVAAEAAAADAASSANFVGLWSNQTGAANIPYSVAHNDISWQLLNNLADVTTSEPSVTADWQAIDPNFFQPLKTVDFTLTVGLKYQVEAIGTPIDGTLPLTLLDGQTLTVHNSSASDSKVQLLNPNFTIRGPAGTILAGTDLEIGAGETAVLVAKGTLILEVS
jgi:hypothetical protein